MHESKIDSKEALDLLLESKNAMRHSYSVYSKFKVGAALITEEGKVFSGTNIENASYGATMCAERVAVFKAVSSGCKKIKSIAITVSSGEVVAPCGICLQVLSEFSENCTIYLQNNEGTKRIQTSLKECLPKSVKNLSTILLEA